MLMTHPDARLDVPDPMSEEDGSTCWRFATLTLNECWYLGVVKDPHGSTGLLGAETRLFFWESDVLALLQRQAAGQLELIDLQVVIPRRLTSASSWSLVPIVKAVELAPSEPDGQPNLFVVTATGLRLLNGELEAAGSARPAKSTVRFQRRL